jgi:hypothetical protein
MAVAQFEPNVANEVINALVSFATYEMALLAGQCAFEADPSTLAPETVGNLLTALKMLQSTGSLPREVRDEAERLLQSLDNEGGTPQML